MQRLSAFLLILVGYSIDIITIEVFERDRLLPREAYFPTLEIPNWMTVKKVWNFHFQSWKGCPQACFWEKGGGRTLVTTDPYQAPVLRSEISETDE